MNVTIDGVEYTPVDTDCELRIVVLDRGFVVVGRVSQNGDMITIDDCSCVRKWGTTKGLGELASDGPTSKTVLDPQPATVVHILQVVQQIACRESSWTR